MTRRQRKMLEMIREQKTVTVAALSRSFEVTEASIRTDLADLENDGLVHRFHGGAKAVQVSAFESRLAEFLPEKRAIVQRAAAHIQPGETLYLDSGTTIMLLARELSTVEGMTIITNSPPLLAYLGPEQDKKIVLIGGEYSYDDQCCFGTMTEKGLQDIYVSKVFMGADSVDVENGGVFARFRNLGYIQAIMKNAKQRILLSVSSKFNRIHGMKIADLSQVDVIITDWNLPGDQRELIRQRGITLEIAGEPAVQEGGGT